MSSIRDELHMLIDQLPESELEPLLEQARRTSQQQNRELSGWWKKVDHIQSDIWPNLPEDMPGIVSILDEIREERLNDLMGGE